jgi:predicted peptidase
MQRQESVPQLTVYYLDGTSESFSIFDAIAGLDAEQETAIDLQQLLQQPLWVFHLPDQTVIIRAEAVLKVEVKPSLFAIQGPGVVNNSDRITALTRMR